MNELNDMPKIETRLEVKNEAENKVAELYLSGPIRKRYPWEEESVSICATDVKAALDKLESKDVLIKLSTPGGCIFESTEIRNMLKSYDGKVTIEVVSVAASGGSLICTGADVVKMYANALQMIHKAWTWTGGNADQLRKTAGDLDKMDTALKENYKVRFVGTDDELDNLLSEATWMTADECLTLGFCDEIIQESAEPQNSTKDDPQVSIKESLFTKYAAQAKDKQPKNETETKQTEPANKGLFHKFTANNGGME